MSKPKNMTPEQEAEWRKNTRAIAKASYEKNRDARIAKVAEYKKTLRLKQGKAIVIGKKKPETINKRRCTGHNYCKEDNDWRCKQLVDFSAWQKRGKLCKACHKISTRNQKRRRQSKRRFYKYVAKMGYYGNIKRMTILKYHIYDDTRRDSDVVSIFKNDDGEIFIDLYVRTGKWPRGMPSFDGKNSGVYSEFEEYLNPWEKERNGLAAYRAVKKEKEILEKIKATQAMVEKAGLSVKAIQEKRREIVKAFTRPIEIRKKQMAAKKRMSLGRKQGRLFFQMQAATQSISMYANTLTEQTP